MERGSNYLTINESERQLFSSSASQPCVFISHKKEDADFARHLSDYVMERGINVYFDENDPILAKEHRSPVTLTFALAAILLMMAMMSATSTLPSPFRRTAKQSARFFRAQSIFPVHGV